MAIAFPTQAQRLSSVADTMLKSSKPSLDWKPVDVATLPPEYAKLYADYLSARELATKRREAFEDAICGPLARMLSARPGQDVAFGYKFGKLSVALTDKATPRAAANALRF